MLLLLTLLLLLLLPLMLLLHLHMHMLVLHHVELRGEACDLHVYPPLSRQGLVNTIHARIRFTFTLQLEAQLLIQAKKKVKKKCHVEKQPWCCEIIQTVKKGRREHERPYHLARANRCEHR